MKILRLNLFYVGIKMFGYRNNFRPSENIINQLYDLDKVINSYILSESTEFSTEITILSLQSHRKDLQNELCNALKADKIKQLIYEANIYRDSGDYQVANDKYDDLLNITKNEFNEFHPLFAEILFYKSIVNQLLGRYDIVLSDLFKLKDYNNKYNINNKNFNALLDYHIASNYYFTNKFKESMILVNDLLNFYSNIDSSQTTNRIYDCKNLYSIILLKQGDIKKAINIMNSVIDNLEAEKIQNFERASLYFSNLAYMYVLSNRYNTAEELNNKAYLLIQENLPQRHPNYIVVLQVMGLINFYQANYSEARKMFELALDIAIEKTPNHPQIQQILENLNALSSNGSISITYV
jgi:tetratricopeptide (TPR) repeat protein